MFCSRCCLFTIIVTLLGICATSSTADDRALSRIAFGSCCKQDRPQPIWETIVAADPDVFLFIGDNIYGDSDDMEVLKAKWQQLGSDAGYQQLKATCPIFATWDDHDYGRNDAGDEFEFKIDSQQVFLDFFEEPADSPRRSRPGLYRSYEFGPPGQRVQILLLDTRYFRGPLVRRDWRPEPGEGDRGPYGRNLDPQATILGEAQWTWLAEKLRQPADVRIIASSIQVIADGHHWEKWGTMPLQRQRLFDVIRDSQATGVIIISGDRHSAEISALDPGIGYSLLDITSSSLNQPMAWHSELNEHRVGTKYYGENFGMITIDWTADDPVIRCQVCDIRGNVALQQRVRLSDLAP